MVRGLYTAYTGMVNSQHRLDVVSNNLANATTTGYKKEGCTTQSFDAVYAVDGGYAEVTARAITPDAVFGDFDSLGTTPCHPEVYEYDTHKDFTDMDLAIHHAIAKGYEELVVCNAFVGRLDHTIGNMQLLIQAASQGVCIWGIEEDEAIAPLVAPGPFSSLSFKEGTQGVCSVLSHSDKAEGICEEGLEWNLDNATGVNRALWGISNEFKGVPARISLAHGSLWVTFPLEELSRAYYDRLSNV